MAEEPTRKLAVLLHADVVGSTALVQKNETLAHQRMQDTFRRFSESIKSHGGIAHEIRGDALVAEFSKASDAVSASLAFQETNTARNENLEDNIRPIIRVGIALGEVVVADNTITGEGIILAQRLEQLAEPGGVCIQDAAYQTVPKRLPFSYDSLGEHELKGFHEPIKAYAVRSRYDVGASEVERKTTEDFSEMPMSARPSIAVLPFTNMSGDPEQDFLADGISEDLITALSKVRWFTVIARNTTFTYKGTSVDVKKVASDLDVRYVLEGSVRTGGNRIRVTAQLIDAHTGHHVWAERYDRELDDIFALQDEMSQTIAGALEPELSAAERERAVNKPPENLGAWEYYQRGLHYSWSWEEENNQTAIDLFREAQSRDPVFAPAYAQEAYAHYQSVVLAWTNDPDSRLAEGRKAADKALQCDDRDAVAYFASARIHMMYGEHDACIAALERSLELNPNFAQSYHAMGMVLALCGNQDESRRQSEVAERLSPRDPILIGFRAVHSLASLLAGDYEEAILWGHKVLQIPKDCGYWPHALIAAASAHLGRMDEARAACEAARQTMPGLTISYLKKTLPTKHEAGLEPWLSGLRKSGLPD